MRTISRSLIVALLGTLALAAPVMAQARPERPYRGLFGAGPLDTRQSLSATASLGVAWDSNLAADARRNRFARIIDAPLGAGTLGQGSAALSYSISRGPLSGGASVSSAARYYPSAASAIYRQESASARARLGLPWSFAVSTSASYRPYTLTSLFPITYAPELDESSAEFEFGASREHFVSYTGGVGWSRQLSRRTTASASYSYASRATTADVPQYMSQGAGGSIRYNLGRGLDARVGYGYGEVRYESRDPITHHSINAGLDFNRSLSFSRRTTLAFDTGMAAAGDPENADRLRYRATGSASLRHELGRTWDVSLVYHRGLRFTDDWSAPLFSDSVSARLAGMISRRFRVHARAGASTGRIGYGESNGFDTFYGDTGIGFALGRFASVGSSYRYHHHRLDDAIIPSPGLVSSLDRHSVHAFISVWAPLFQR
jgi:hypothetical protein